MRCVSCSHTFCFAHGDSHPGKSCSQWARDNMDAEKKTEEVIKSFTKPCPGCNVATQKSAGCNHMKCTQCKTEWSVVSVIMLAEFLKPLILPLLLPQVLAVRVCHFARWHLPLPLLQVERVWVQWWSVRRRGTGQQQRLLQAWRHSPVAHRFSYRPPVFRSMVCFPTELSQFSS